jgi:acetylornithine deacetylase/succinyl-diaminopimelate desuccinylase-like protein
MLLRWLSLLMVFCCAVGAATLAPEQDQRLAHDIYKQLVEIQSGFTTGSTTPVAEAVGARLRAAGFPAADIFVGGASPKKANIVVRYHGTGARKPMLLLAHEDVVEAKREDWTTDPFQFIEKDGFYYGRGTADDKAQAAIWIANLIRFKREGFKPDRDIIVALTADEEGVGPFSGIKWLLKNHRELIDAEFCLNEGGRVEMAGGKLISNDVQVSEKWYVDFRFEVHNKGGHSSLPSPDNAIYHLAAALDRLAHFSFPVKTNEVTKAYFAAQAKIETGPIQKDIAAVSNGSQEAMESVAAHSLAWNATLRTTCVATQLEGGHARNALPQMAGANVNCRILPEDSIEYVLATLKKVVADDQVSVEVAGDMERAPGSPLRPDILKAMNRVTDSMWPGIPVVPNQSTGATDGRFLRAAGIPTYGVQGFAGDRDDYRAHGKDERMLVKSFYEGQAFLYEVVKILASPAGN